MTTTVRKSVEENERQIRMKFALYVWKIGVQKRMRKNYGLRVNCASHGYMLHALVIAKSQLRNYAT